MRRALVCTGILGGGTAVVFALALLVALLFPQGSLVPVGWTAAGWRAPGVVPRGGGWVDDVWFDGVARFPAGVDQPAPQPMPLRIQPADDGPSS